jgi:signal transduction histidine kinase
MVSITIEDSGIGMEQDFVDNHIFKPFAKANVHAVRLAY